MYLAEGVLNPAWSSWFQQVWLRIGKEIALTNVQLESIQQGDLDELKADVIVAEAAILALQGITSTHTTQIAKLQADVEAINLEPRT